MTSDHDCELNQQNNGNYKLLFEISQKIFSSIEIEHVLKAISEAVEESYPAFLHHLFLTQIYEQCHSLPLKELVYTEESESRLSTMAYKTGKIQIDDAETSGSSVSGQIFVPMIGKQGTYGVLQVISINKPIFPKEDIYFITAVSNLAGTAIENASLHQHSKRLIDDLMFVNKTSRTLNTNLRLSETTAFMNKQLKESFDADQVGFILFKETEANEYQILDGSTDYFLLKEASSFIAHIQEVLETEEALFIGDFLTSNPEIAISYRSVIAAPMTQSDDLIGAIVLLHTDAYAFSFESFKLFQTLVHHSTLAFVNSMLREKLEQLVITDYLTKLYSRKYLDEKLHEHMKADVQGTFILIDIDDFKIINDTYGHDTGDFLIVQVANIIKSHIGKEDFAARWGGEELAVYLPNGTISDGMEMALQLVRQVEAFTEPAVTISCGVSYWNSQHYDQPKSVFDRADVALYEAKKMGKNCVVKERYK
ncbi:diguanylate cyclase [Aquibacillus sp. 3ASR75-11]|uniref:Diguanylate cyclase n=1 Tax=Terrihalobacillus insolitus TaxID=2950438 RepID=A0A9X3WQG8_9BACI|nr:diguanylate cyclase [Terrihalobacillus insolitus]MDC3412672.1 diguanylate cyclase [Terrihalobacillus insolitus]MDC3424022.1 diguanylate cyclase [Terrihalobacillus insolitus]